MAILTTFALGVCAFGLVGGAIASSWEADNDADEEELERMREKNRRLLNLRRSQMRKRAREKMIKVELIAREKELKLVKRAALLADRHLACGENELEQFRKELTTINKADVKLPKECVEELFADLVGKNKDLKRVCKRSKQHLKEVDDRIAELKSSRFYFRCVSCHRKFAVQFGELANFRKSREGMRKCCDACYPEMKERKLTKRTRGGMCARSAICRMIGR